MTLTISQVSRPHTPARPLVLLLIVLVSLFAFTLVRNAWVCDDAYITFRTVDNFIHGYGLTWNVAERVQAYTHPLWMFVLSLLYFFTREIYLTSTLLSMAVSLAALLVFAWKIARSATAALVCILILTLSKAFIDYSTSGLENPLTHLILVAFFVCYFRLSPSRKTLFVLSLLSALCSLNRMDTVLLCLPALLYSLWELREVKGIYCILLGQTPLFLWECFSLFYYGFPFPNTAYAKLNTGIPSGELVTQGLYYLLNSLRFDPLTLVTITGALALPWLTRNRRAAPLAVGVFLYLLYIVRIGGDFMSGRFLAAPLLCAIVVIARYDFTALRAGWFLLLLVAVTAIGLSAPHPTLWIGDVDPELSVAERAVFIDRRGIADERAYYYSSTGLLMLTRTAELPDFPWKTEGLFARAAGVPVVVRESIGLFGFYAGPDVYVVDRLALADPLLAQLPAARRVNWRIGHFYREIPEGYLETLRSGQNVIADERLAVYYDRLARVTRGSLFDLTRLIEIWNVNTGRYDGLVDFDAYRYPQAVHVSLADVATPQVSGTQAGIVSFSASGVEIDVGLHSHATQMEISLDSNDDYQVVYLDGDTLLAAQTIPASFMPRGLSVHLLHVPSRAANRGFNRIRLLPLRGDETFRLGHIRLY
jgi:arabinofuranosyltransferase